MSKNKIIVVLLIMLSICVISLYTTYAYEENENPNNGPSFSTDNLIYTLKESTNKEIVVGAREEKFIDINLTNTYDTTIKYGMYYYMVNSTNLPNGVTITLYPNI